ncbi:radical SAM protein [Cellulomonas carbonis]|uniref:radical SAM protein n=1 Tax=Cellulomonas carbonis TaxID=1386092 RepID=UPI00166701A9|nr:radical SAM protein [Cellulomonas carbonis]
MAWNYTYACNFNCSHCYSRAPWYPKELDRQAYLDIADQMTSAGVFKVGLGGGEPLIRRDAIEVVEKLASGGVDTNITTNGWLVDENVAGRLSDAGLNSLYVSIDGVDAATHDLFRRKNGSFDRAVSAISASVKMGLRVRLSTVVTRQNLRRLRDLTQEDRFKGVDCLELKRFRPAGNGVASRSLYELTSEDEEVLRETMEDLARSSPIKVVLIYGDEPGGADLDAGCPCGTRSITLRPNGDVAPCAYTERIIGNLSSTRLTDIWQGSNFLADMRSHPGCLALDEHRAPSNPGSFDTPRPRRSAVREQSAAL